MFLEEVPIFCAGRAGSFYAYNVDPEMSLPQCGLLLDEEPAQQEARTSV